VRKRESEVCARSGAGGDAAGEDAGFAGDFEEAFAG